MLTKNNKNKKETTNVCAEECSVVQVELAVFPRVEGTLQGDKHKAHGNKAEMYALQLLVQQLLLAKDNWKTNK